MDTTREKSVDYIRKSFEKRGKISVGRSPKIEINAKKHDEREKLKRMLMEEGFLVICKNQTIIIKGPRMIYHWSRAIGIDGSENKIKIDTILKHYC